MRSPHEILLLASSLALLLAACPAAAASLVDDAGTRMEKPFAMYLTGSAPARQTRTAFPQEPGESGGLLTVQDDIQMDGNVIGRILLNDDQRFLRGFRQMASGAACLPRWGRCS